MTKPLVDYYGAEACWNTSLTTLGFPGTWITEQKEAAALNAALRKERQR